MKCPQCKTVNDDQYVFCVNCGASISPRSQADEIVPPTVRHVPKIETSTTPPDSVETVITPGTNFRPMWLKEPEPIRVQESRSRPVGKILAAGLAAILLLGIVAIGGYFALTWPKTATEKLPDHLGMFAQSSDKNRLDEIEKIDLSNLLDGKENLMKDESLPMLDPSPTVILYSEGKEVPVSDLHLIQIDTIKEDGSFKQIDFQASPIENKPEMKRLKIPDGVANGKYAFALIDGFLNEGKHKFWPFQVRGAAKSDNGNALHAVTVAIKPTPTPVPTVKASTPTPVPPPVNGTPAYSATNNLILRGGPSQDAVKLRNLRRGEKIYILYYSDNTEVFEGIESRFAFVQTANGQTGWVFAAFLR